MASRFPAPIRPVASARRLASHPAARFPQIVLILTMTALFCTGCATVKDTVFLEDLNATSPVWLPPAHVTRNEDHQPLTISPFVSVANNSAIDAPIAANVYEPDSIRQRRHHLAWSIPGSSVGFNANFRPSSSVGISLGFSHSAMQGEEFWTGSAGLNLPFHGQDVSGCIEGGYHWQTSSYDAFSMLVRETSSLFGQTERTILYFHDIDRATSGNFYITFSLNSVGDRLLNGFVSLSYSPQSITKFSPNSVYPLLTPVVVYEQTDARVDQTAEFFILAPGIIWNINPTVRLLTGFRWIRELQISDDYSRIAPMIQMDFDL